MTEVKTFRLTIQEALGSAVTRTGHMKPILGPAKCLTLLVDNMTVDQVQLDVARKLCVLPEKFSKGPLLFKRKFHSKTAKRCLFSHGCDRKIEPGEPYYAVRRLHGAKYSIPTCFSCAKREFETPSEDP